MAGSKVTAEKLATRHNKLITRRANLDKRVAKAQATLDNVENERHELDARIALAAAQYASAGGVDELPTEPIAVEVDEDEDESADDEDEVDDETEDDDSF